MDEPLRMGRREFGRGVAFGACGIAGISLRNPVAAEDQPTGKSKELKRNETPEVAEERPVVPPEFLLLTYLMRRFPNEHFDKEALAGIYRDIRGDVARSRELQDFPLQNSDEPAFIFRAYSAG